MTNLRVVASVGIGLWLSELQIPPLRLRSGRDEKSEGGIYGFPSKSSLTIDRPTRYSSPKMIREEATANGELIQGTLEMLILKALARGPLHGYAVAEWVEQTSQQVLRVEEGALYPALHRLQLRGLLQAEWGASENNRRAKFYQLTATGKKRLNAESQRWAKLSAAVAFVMQAP
jgi:PadR family transcriptional regulator, regulatory protein PadR